MADGHVESFFKNDQQVEEIPAVPSYRLKGVEGIFRIHRLGGQAALVGQGTAKFDPPQSFLRRGRYRLAQRRIGE